MKSYNQNQFFSFQIAENRLVQKAPSSGPAESQAAKVETNEAKEPEISKLEDKALKTIDRLGRLMSAMKDRNEVKPKYAENFKKLQEMQKKLQEHIDNVDAKKEELSAKIIDKTLDDLDTAIKNNPQLHLLNRHLLEGKNQDGGLIADALHGIEYGIGDKLVTIYSLMSQGKRTLQNGEYKGGSIEKKGDKLIIYHPEKGTFTFTFKIEEGKWNAYDKNGNETSEQSVNRQNYEDQFNGKTIRINPEKIKSNYYEKDEDKPKNIAKTQKGIPTKKVPTEVKKHTVDTSKITPDQPAKKAEKPKQDSGFRMPTEMETNKKPEYTRSEEEDRLIQESKGEKIDPKLNKIFSSNASEALNALNQYLDVAKPLAKAIEKTGLSWKQASKLVIKFKNDIENFYRDTNQNTPTENVKNRMHKIKNNLPQSVQDIYPVNILERGTSEEKQKTPQEKQENEQQSLTANINSLKDGLNKLNDPKDVITVETTGGSLRISKLGENKYSVTILGLKPETATARLSENEIKNLAMQMTGDKIQYVSAETLKAKLPKLNETPQEKPSQMARNVRDILSKSPIDQKALQASLRKIANNPQFSANEHPIKLGQTGYFLTKGNDGNVRIEIRNGDGYTLAFLTKNREKKLYSYNPIKKVLPGELI
ncbi:hypothetical protein KKC45_00420 [Patescibacteria group bacterium]|nr:hypothetical protein [Patescibacteria group bacterium]